jgi:hypothetical protein
MHLAYNGIYRVLTPHIRNPVRIGSGELTNRPDHHTVPPVHITIPSPFQLVDNSFSVK